jgi:hypothetical protein
VREKERQDSEQGEERIGTYPRDKKTDRDSNARVAAAVAAGGSFNMCGRTIIIFHSGAQWVSSNRVIISRGREERERGGGRE